MGVRVCEHGLRVDAEFDPPVWLDGKCTMTARMPVCRECVAKIIFCPPPLSRHNDSTITEQV